MQLGQAQTVRSDWYDRSLLTIADHYFAIGGPHASAVRLSYTVPANRVGVLNYINATAKRATAASAAGNWGYFIDITPDGGSAKRIWYPTDYGIAINDGFNIPFAPNQHLVAGDVIQIYSVDNSTGGTVFYNISYGITLFDA